MMQAFVSGLGPPPAQRLKTGGGLAAEVPPEEAAVMLAEYLAGRRSEAPWRALGAPKAVAIDGEPPPPLSHVLVHRNATGPTA